MKGKIRIIAKFHRTDLVICSHSRERKPPSYSQRNTVCVSKYGSITVLHNVATIHTEVLQDVNCGIQKFLANILCLHFFKVPIYS